ncbi:hypothetical protein G7046_g6673 [Stylonectria norvegica]|nr:hypothetical protein G7046_g6673 [Stylonectria norvegica]
MKSISTTAIAAAVLALYSRGASAGTATHCSGDSKDVCFQWGVPESAMSSGSGNVYFQLEAPSTYQWIGLGIGSQMAGAKMFLIYNDGNGNVTLSTRAGTGHVMPQYTERSDVELLAGSGVSGGKMTANVKCSKCDDLKLGESNSWISAWKTGDSLDSTNVRENIQQHDEEGVFKVDFSQASISSDVNPFVNATNADSQGGSTNSTGSDSSSGSGSPAVTDDEDSGPSDKLANAHGIVMSIVFLIGYPIGAIIMPIIGKWFIHAGWQMLAFLGMWAGFGLGYVFAKDDGSWFKQTHTRMGTIIVALIALQPILGWIHHNQYARHQKRSAISHVHIWFGRALLILGAINGGLGLQLAGSSRKYIIAYSVVAGVISALYVASAFWGASRRTRGNKLDSPQMSQEERRQRARSAVAAVSRVARVNAVQMRGFIAPTVSRRADFVQELYLKELKAYKTPAVKESDSEGQVQLFNLPKAPESPEETDLASNLQEYETMAVEIEGQDATTAAGGVAEIPDWLEAEEEDEPHH